jgi:type IX secretion system PorP/SprF family membrane protein
MMKAKALLLAILCFAGAANAQVYFQNTLYTFNQFVYNPAAAGLPQAGLVQGPRLTLMGRSQWAGINGAPRTGTLAFQHYDSTYSSAIGALAAFESIGPFSSSRVDLAYAFVLPLGDLRLRFGVNGGARQVRVSADWMPEDPNDPTLPLTPQTAFQASLGAGLMLSDATGKFFVGLSAQDLLEPSLEGLLVGDVGTESTVARSFFLMGGYRFDLGDRMSLTPSVFLRTEGTRPQADLSLLFTYKPIIFGLNYRVNSNDSFSGVLGFQISDRTFLGYSYDYTLSSLNGSADVHTNEIVLSYAFPRSARNPNKTKDILNDPNPF